MLDCTMVAVVVILCVVIVVALLLDVVRFKVKDILIMMVLCMHNASLDRHS